MIHHTLSFCSASRNTSHRRKVRLVSAKQCHGGILYSTSPDGCNGNLREATVHLTHHVSGCLGRSPDPTVVTDPLSCNRIRLLASARTLDPFEADFDRRFRGHTGDGGNHQAQDHIMDTASMTTVIAVLVGMAALAAAPSAHALRALQQVGAMFRSSASSATIQPSLLSYTANQCILACILACGTEFMHCDSCTSVSLVSCTMTNIHAPLISHSFAGFSAACCSSIRHQRH